MNKGTYEGTEEEINFVKLLNSDKKSGYWDILNLPFKGGNLFAIHITEHKFGKINGSMIKPKADLFIAVGKIEEAELKKRKYYLEESDAKIYGLKPLEQTGISVKRRDSERYQILKMNPSTFKKIFGSFELGAGASVYCLREKELDKNISVLEGWNTNLKKFSDYWKFEGYLDKNTAEKIKKEATDRIYDMIDKNRAISDFVFMGVGNFEEPFTAAWFFEGGKLKKARKISFVVTTGSGRSHGDFTIVIKPKS